MNEERRRILACAVMVRRGILAPAAAEAALRPGAGDRAKTPDPGAATVRPGDSPVVGEVDPLDVAMATLERSRQEEILRQVEDLSSNAAAARAFVTESGLPSSALQAWDALAPSAEPGPSGVPIPVQAPREPRYTLRREHARGGMGRVLIVADAAIGRDIALKEILAPAAPGQPGGTGATLSDQERFLREARITGQLEHPNIVPVHEIGHRSDGSPYYTMKFVRGESMADRLKAIARDFPDEEKRLAKRLQLLDAFVDVCNAVGYAHSRGVINRDLKPANVMLGDYGETFVLDWGLAKIEGQEDRTQGEVLKQSVARSRAVTPAQGDSTKLTLDGAIMGTPSYMSPEQARGEIDAIDRLSDVYSLGAILYEILTGHAPFEGPDLTVVLRSAMTLSPAPVLGITPLCPRELAAVAHRALARDKADRFRSARALADEVQAFRDGRRLSVYRYSLAEQLSRFARRNRALAGAAALSFAALAVAAGVSIRWARVASSESDNALRSLAAARAAESQARASSEEAVRRAKLEQEAKEATQRALVVAEGQRLAAVATPIAASNPGQALLLAIEAARRAPGMAANNAMMVALLRLCERRRLYEHALPPDCGTFSPSGRLAATGGADFVVRVWNVETGVQLRQFDDHRGAIRDVAFSPDSLLVASASDDHVVRIWAIDEGTLRAAMEGHTKRVTGVQFVAGGKRVLSWSDDGTARLWTLDGKPAGIFEEAGSAAIDARVSPDGSRALTLSAGGAAILWNTADASRIARLGLDGELAAGIDLSPDGLFAVTAGRAGHGDLWSIREGRHESRIFQAPAELAGVLFSPDGNRVAFQGREQGLRVVDLSKPGEAAALTFEGPLKAGKISPDWSTWLQTSSLEPQLRRSLDGRVLATYQGHDYSLRAHAFSPDGKLVLTMSHDRTCGVWSTEPGAALAAPAALDGWYVEALVDGGRQAVVQDDSKNWRRIDLATGKAVRELPSDPWAGSPRGDLVALPGENSATLLMLDTATGTTLREIPLEGEYRRHLSTFSEDGAFFMAATPSGTATVWETATGTRTGSVLFHGATAASLAPGGRTLAVGNTSHAVVALFDVATGAETRVLRGHSGTICFVRFSPDGRTIATNAADATVRLWDVASGRQIAVYRWPRADSVRLEFSPDGRYLALLAGEFVRIVEAQGLKDLFTVSAEFAPDDVAFSPASDAFLFRDSARRWHRVPIDLLPLALASAPRPITPSEMSRFEVGTEAERKAYVDAWQTSRSSIFSDWLIGNQALNTGDFDKAISLFRRAAAALPRHPDGPCFIAQALCSRAGARPEADRAADIDEALASLELAARLGAVEADWLRTEPVFRLLDGNPRFKLVLEAFEANARR